MKYMGSKNRIAKHILPIVLRGRVEGQYYVEPFVGGANMIDKVDGPRIGGDYNEFIAEMWKALEGGWKPADNFTKFDYAAARDGRIVDKAVVGWLGVNCSYSGKWFAGFAGKTNTKKGIRDYQKEAHRNTMAQVPNIKGVTFVHSSYEALDIPDNSIIYCDPPYRGTTGYKDNFNHAEFWEWCRAKASQGHTVFISEYTAPDDFRCVWEKEVSSSLSANGNIGGSKKSIERLFTI